MKPLQEIHDQLQLGTIADQQVYQALFDILEHTRSHSVQLGRLHARLGPRELTDAALLAERFLALVDHGVMAINGIDVTQQAQGVARILRKALGREVCV